MSVKKWRKRTLQRLRRSIEAFLVLVMSKGSEDSPSSNSPERPVGSPASRSFSAAGRWGEPFAQLIVKTVAGEMAPSIYYLTIVTNCFCASYQTITTNQQTHKQQWRNHFTLSFLLYNLTTKSIGIPRNHFLIRNFKRVKPCSETMHYAAVSFLFFSYSSVIVEYQTPLSRLQNDFQFEISTQRLIQSPQIFYPKFVIFGKKKFRKNRETRKVGNFTPSFVLRCVVYGTKNWKLKK